MKTITSLKFFITIITIAVFVLIIKSCKKIDKDGDAITTEAEATKAAAIKAIKEKYGDISGGIIIPVNKSADEYFYRDASGNMTSLYGNLNNRPGINGPSLCKANCSTTSNPADLRIVYTLDYVQRFYGCEASTSNPPDKSTVSVKWTVSVPFQIGYTLNNFPPLHYGDIKFKNSSGTVINTLIATNGSVTSTMIGADPNCSTWNNLWEVTYTFTLVANSNFVSGNTIEASVSLENDCALVGNVVTSGYISAPSFSQNADLPCNRIDKVYVSPNTGPNNCTTATGNYAVCSYPTGLTPIDDHQLEYREVTSSTSILWSDQTGTIRRGIPTGTSTESSTVYPYGTSNLIFMTPGSGDWLVRYRNVNNTSCPVLTPVGSSAWGNNWITEFIPL